MKFSLNTSTASALHLNRNLSAPRERIFQALTDASELQKWWGGPAVIEPKVGGNVEVSGRTGKVRELNKNEMLVFSMGGEGPKKDVETLVTIELRKSEKGTHVSVTHEGLPDAAAQERHRVAWVERLDRLTAHVG